MVPEEARSIEVVLAHMCVDGVFQDAKKNNVLHHLAMLPSDDAPPIKGKKRKEIFEAAVRMANMYWDFC